MGTFSSLGSLACNVPSVTGVLLGQTEESVDGLLV